MNMHNVVKLADRLASAVDADLEGENFAVPAAELPDEEAVDAHAALFRRAVARYGRQAAEARRACKAEVKAIGAERKAQMEIYRRIMAGLDEREAQARADGAEKEGAAQRLAASYAGALARLEGGL